MAQINFRHQQKKRKTWLLPLIIIVLLYISIPFMLIMKGDESIKKGIFETEKKEVLTPSLKYNKGLVFLETAEAFPGFDSWAKNIKRNSAKKMLEIYSVKCKQKSIDVFLQISKYSDQYDSLNVNFNRSTEFVILNASIFSGKEKKNIKITIPSKISNKINDEFCNVWKVFLTNLEIEIPEPNLICKP